jgi:hypothetical protein
MWRVMEYPCSKSYRKADRRGSNWYEEYSFHWIGVFMEAPRSCTLPKKLARMDILTNRATGASSNTPTA